MELYRKLNEIINKVETKIVKESRQAQFSIGTQFVDRNSKRKDIETVVDIYTTFNSRNEIVNIEYVAEHDFNGTKLLRYNIPQSSIARGLIK